MKVKLFFLKIFFIGLIQIIFFLPLESVYAVYLPGLVGRWALDEGTGNIANDSSDYGNNLSFVDNPTWINGKLGNALSFDGINDGLKRPDTSILEPDNMTVSFWAKINKQATVIGHDNMFVYKAYSGAGAPYYSYQIYEDSFNRTFAANWVDSSGNDYYVETNSKLATNVWYYLTFVRNGAALRVYINGVDDTNPFIIPPPASAKIFNSDSSFYLGQFPDPLQFLNGVMDEVCFFNRGLTSAEIQTLYNANGDCGGYAISGKVFNDINKNKVQDGGETSYTGPAQITSTGGTVVLNPATNSYNITGLSTGTYTVSASFPPSLLPGYKLIEPKPSIFSVTVGPSCSVANTLTGGYCDGNGSIQNLNFAVTDSWPWMQFYGLGTRFDGGVDNPLPASTTCGGGSFAQGTTSGMSSPGIAFTGDESADYGQGSVSSSGRSVGGISYPEVYSGTSPLKTSATGLRSAAEKAGYTITQLNSVPACSNPDQHCNLQGNPKGFYATSGDLMIDQPLNIASGNYVIVADGNITFGNNVKITVTQGATLIIAAGKDIIVDQTISSPANACPVPAGQLQGIFSAGRNFIIQGNNGDCSNPADTMVNIDGSLIINSELNGGTLQNQRDLCGGNTSYPSFTITSRPDFILNLPTFIFKENVIMHEDTP